jgi:CheY-like chemotaxis protein/anti-sigma regulatory factor (Ser/Thr protein kinase)
VQRERLEIARDNGLRLLKLVNSLLDFSRVEAGSVPTRLVAVDLAQVTADLVSTFRSAFAAAGLELEARIDDPGTPIEVDADAWESIVLNLLSNALKFTHEGRVSVELVAGPELVELRVDDTGIGIDPAEIERIFERFYRAPNDAGRSMEGTGIGLALTRELARLHGGDVSVSSRPGAGSTFTVRIPARRGAAAARGGDAGGSVRARSFVEEAFRWLPEAAAAEAPSAAAARAAGGVPAARVLVVDDNADMRRYLSRVLSASYEVVLAANGAEALELARRRRPGVVVCDVMMPVLDGLGFVSTLRADEELSSLPVLLLSARAGREATVEGLEKGADDYLVKPFSARELSARVAALLASAERREESAERELARRFVETLPAEVTRALATATDLDAIARAAQGVLTGDPAFIGLTLSVRERGSPSVTQHFGRAGASAEITARYRRTPLELDTIHTRALRTGETGIFPDFAALSASFPGHTEELRQLGVASAAVLPLAAADGEVIGGLLMGWRLELAFDAGFVTALEGFAQSVSRAVERVQGYEMQRELATGFQLALLGVEVTTTAAVVRTRYRAADRAVEVGGDWYDAVELADGRLAVGVGDVVGRGLPAAAAMSQLRAGLAAVLLQSGDPAESLDALERFARGVHGATCTTAAVAVLDTVASSVTYHCAGHPYPVFVSPAGEVALLSSGRSWPLLAGPPQRRRRPADVAFPPGSTLLLYTDGLVERRGESLEDGLQRLCDSVRSRWNHPLSLLEGELVAELVEALGASDDLALVGVRRCGAVPGMFADAISAAPSELRAVRRRLSGWLRSEQLDEETHDAALLAAGEACANAVEHGSRGDPAAVVAVEAAIVGDELLLAVSDSGSWRPGVDGFRSGRGRGHRIMESLARQVNVVTDRQGSVVMLRLPAGRSAAV